MGWIIGVEDEEAAFSRSVGILPTSSIPGRAMRPRSADSCRDVQTANEREGTRMGEKRGSWIVDRGSKNKPLLHVAGASCSSPSMERPAPCSAQSKNPPLLI